MNCHGVTVTMSDMNTVQKIQEEKIFNETIYYRDKPKTGQKWPNFTKWPNTFFMPNVVKKWPDFLKLARKWPICQPWTISLFAEVAGVTVSDSDSVPVPKFWNPGPDPGPAIFQIWESDSCSDSGCNHQSNTLIYPCFYLSNDHTDSCYCRNSKVTPDLGPVFRKFFTPGPVPGRKEKRRILPESTSVIRIRSHLCLFSVDNWMV